MAAKEHPRYQLTDWPDWEFVEFPMMVYPHPGNPDIRKPVYNPERPGQLLSPGVTVNSEEELVALLEGAETVKDGDKTRLLTEEDKRQALILKADQTGVKVDKTWSLDKLEAALAPPETVV